MISHAKMAAGATGQLGEGPMELKLRTPGKGCCLAFASVPPFGRGSREPRTQTSEEGMLVGAGVCEGHTIRLVLSV